MSVVSFSFENSAVRTLGSPEAPLFVALDVCNALQHSNPWKAVKDLCDDEDVSKQEIVDAKGRKQTVNCVNESGLYALIFGSKLESAKRFKRWVTSEVLPAIRKTGCYEYTDGERNCDQYMIRKAVAKRAKASSVHYQTIYNALYDRYRISSYKQLRHDQIREALTFIECFDLKPQLEAAPSIGPKDIVLKEEEITAILVFIYYWTRLFREPLEIFYASLASVQSPFAPRFYEAVHGMRLSSLEKRLAQHGRTLDELPVYQHWLAGQAA